MSEKSNSEKKHRVTVTVPESTYQMMKYWAKKNDCSINEFQADAIELMIRYQNHDYDLATCEINRLNQLIDTVTVLSENTKSLEDIVTSGFDSLLNLTRGDNYLLENEDGEI